MVNQSLSVSKMDRKVKKGRRSLSLLPPILYEKPFTNLLFSFNAGFPAEYVHSTSHPFSDSAPTEAKNYPDALLPAAFVFQVRVLATLTPATPRRLALPLIPDNAAGKWIAAR